MNSTKKTAILGLIGGLIIMLGFYIDKYSMAAIEYGMNTGFNVIAWFSIKILLGLGITCYFVTILFSFYKRKGNVKLANNILIVSTLLFLYCGFMEEAPFYMGKVLFLISIVILIYFINIFKFKGKFKIINNKLLLLVLILTIIGIIYEINISQPQYTSVSRWGVYAPTTIFIIPTISLYIGIILITPYFYNYYKILKGE